MVKEWVRKWLDVEPATTSVEVKVTEISTRESDVLRNKLWYRGDPTELEQYFKLTSLSSSQFSRFWASAPDDVLVRKIHSGIPRMIADKLSGIVTEDMNDIDSDNAVAVRWEDWCKAVDFTDILKDAVTSTLVSGDGAFKVCVDPTLSDKPLLEFYSGNDVDFEYKRGQLQKIFFFTTYMDDKGKKLKLIEEYGKGYVSYELRDYTGKLYDLEYLEETADLKPVKFDGDYIMGVPLKFYKSAKYDNRGESIYEGKSDLFDALDEVISTWVDTLRAARIKQYIPEMLLPRDPDTGKVLKPNVFNIYTAVGNTLTEEAKNEIQVKQGDIKHDSLLATYITILDCTLQGLISPSTLGIDVKKLDNAESQREKEKTTLYTRDILIGALSKVLPVLFSAVLKTWDNMLKQQPQDYVAEFTWGQYANPSFEAIVETVGKAKTHGIMSIEQCVNELYGDDMSEEDKAEEVARLKSESAGAMEEVGMPGVNDEVLEE